MIGWHSTQDGDSSGSEGEEDSGDEDADDNDDVCNSAVSGHMTAFCTYSVTNVILNMRKMLSAYYRHAEHVHDVKGLG
jgi:hypothetical protein